MPLTIAHPAAAVPLRRLLGRRAVLSALIVGSVVPDLVYFLPGMERVASHSLAGVLWFGLPFGLLSYGLYHWLVSPLVFATLPASIRARLSSQPGVLPSRDLVSVALCIELGALTHVGWDHFTHLSGHAQFWPWLAQPLFRVGGYTMFGFSMLQHMSTLLGLGLLLRWSRAWFLATPPRSERLEHGLSPALKVALVLQIVAPALLVGVAAAWPALDANIGSWRVTQLFCGLAVIAGGRVFLCAVIAVGLLWRLGGAARFSADHSAAH